jgi:hypothetical protein
VAATFSALFFGSTIRLNDSTGYTTEVRTSDDYTLPSELSDAGRGNYWGLGCPGFDQTQVLFDSGAVNPHVTDSHPYGQPVADTPESLLPATCN